MDRERKRPHPVVPQSGGSLGQPPGESAPADLARGLAPNVVSFALGRGAVGGRSLSSRSRGRDGAVTGRSFAVDRRSDRTLRHANGGGMPPPPRPLLEAALIEGILARDGNSCAHCGSAGGETSLSLAMAIPPSLGGLCRWQNLLAVCRECMSAKGDRTALRFDLDRFRSLVGEFGAATGDR